MSVTLGKKDGDTLAVVILAAGLGKRMHSDLPKVLHTAYGKTLLERVVETAATIAPLNSISVVLGAGKEKVLEFLADYGFVGRTAIQAEQRGTGDAVKSALPEISPTASTVLILCGDVPLLKSITLQALLHKHTETKSTLTFLTLRSNAQTGYGRIVRDREGSVLKIVEVRDCTPTELLLNELNSGVMIVDVAFLAPALAELKNDNSQGEYYLTDVVGRAVKEGQRVSTLTIEDNDEIQGVNTLSDLALVEQALMNSRVSALANAGVIFTQPQQALVGPDVIIAPGVKVGCGVELLGKTALESGVIVEGYARLENCTVGVNSVIKWCTRAEGAQIGADCAVGPFANLRPGTVLGSQVKVGNFVETKNVTLGADSKASHLAYLGDATIGEHVNIGAGTITCNYDGKNKFKTVINDGVFVGSNSCLVAPVTLGENSTIGAGSVITKNVSANSLAIGRSRQVEKANWKKTS